MFTAALFIIARCGRNPDVHQLMDGWMDEQNVDYSHNGLLLRQTRNEILIRATSWMNPENTTVSGRRQTQKATCKIPFMLNVQNK